MPSPLPILPLRDTVLVPHVVTPILVGRPQSLAAVEAAMQGDRRLVLVAQKDAEVQAPAGGDLHRVGVIARLQHLARLPNGTVKAVVETMERVRLTRIQGTPPTDDDAPAAPLRATTAAWPLPAGAPDAPHAPGAAPEEGRPSAALAASAAARRLAHRFEEYAAAQRRVPTEVVALLEEAPSAERLAWAVAAHVLVRSEVRQQLLEAPDLPALLARLDEVLGGEIELLGLQARLDDKVRGTIARNQREFWLGEQLKAIHQELGHDEGDDLLALEQQVRAKRLPESVEARALREVRRLRKMPPVSPEATVSRTLVDWILALPWHERTAGTPDLAAARAALDAEHHGLEEVKDRVLDYLAVLAMTGEARGPVLCLVGPPGVGKTSLARSIARALGRKFVRMSLGGVRDEAEIRGHRRTYVGAMPGRLIQAMRRAEVTDPVILLDEIDKMGSDWRGDPAAALLEVLDPEQNASFVDHFLEVEYDLSRVVFITTANGLSQIPEPLRDRMELVRIPGYLEPEKLTIAEQFLVPRQLEAAGLAGEPVRWAPGAMQAIVRGWTREAGVRDLERRIARVARKLARQRAEVRGAAEADGATKGKRRRPPKLPPLAVATDDLPALLGPAPFDPDDTTLDDKVGVANGLAYTAVGGELLEVEVSVVPGRGRVQLTGALGDVMKESASAAMSYVRSRAPALGIDPDFHKTRDVHVHLPAGATPKDGPSAGITIATALVSALTGVPVRGDVAMTGEITLRGRVLPIGGLKEKGVAAHRHGIREVLIPQANARNLTELPESVRAELTWHAVTTVDEVLAHALRRPVLDAARAADAADGPAAPPASAGRRAPALVPAGTPRAATTRREGKSGRAKRVAAKPLAAQPTGAKPVTAKSTAAKPVSAKPVSAKPVTAKPVSAKPVSAKPARATSKGRRA